MAKSKELLNHLPEQSLAADLFGLWGNRAPEGFDGGFVLDRETHGFGVVLQNTSVNCLKNESPFYTRLRN